LAQHGHQLYEAADAAHADLLFEAAVAGAVPVVRGLRESLAGDRITRVLGVVNGTTNYIVDEMTNSGLDFETALAQAQQLGYADATPSTDAESLAAARTAAILASLAFHTRTSIAGGPGQGINQITPGDIDSAAQTRHVINLLAIAGVGAHVGTPGMAVRVPPA